MKKKLAHLFTGLIVVLVVVSSLMVVHRLDTRPRTDDASIVADVVHFAPEVSGRIISLNVVNNQSVHAGDVLFVIDRQPFELRLEAARAQTRSLESKIDDTLNEVASQVSRADAAHTAISNAQAQLALASSTLARLTPLLGKGFVTAEQIDQARTTRDSARIVLDQAIQQARASRQAVSSVRPLEEQLTASRANEALAARDLEKTVMTAPFEGKVIGLGIAAGEYAVAGHPLFTLIDTSRWYAVANFRETQLAHMTPGTPATVYLMEQPNLPLRGRVESVGWGVISEDSSEVNGIPRIVKTLDWVRLSQRFPVRVLLDGPPQDIIRLGASAVVVVRYGDQH